MAVVRSGEYGESPMRKVIGTPSQIPTRSLAQGLLRGAVFFLQLGARFFPSPAVNLPVSECNLERILRASCRTYTSPGVLWNRMEGKRDVEAGWKE